MTFKSITWSTISASAARLVIRFATRNGHSCCKNWLPSPFTKSAELEFCRRKIELHARPEVRDILIAHKLRYWSLRARYPSTYPNCSASRARRNFLRLLAKYPQIGKRLSLDVLSAYPPL